MPTTTLPNPFVRSTRSIASLFSPTSPLSDLPTLWRAALIGLILLTLPSTVDAGEPVTVVLAPDMENVLPGDLLTLDVLVTDLGDGAAPSLGGFDVALSFDPARFEFAAAVPGLDLGDPDLGEALEVSTVGPSNYELLVLSLLSPADLIANQGETVALFSAAFIALEPGSAAFDLTLNAPLADEDGNALDVAPIEPPVVVVGAPIDIPTLNGLGLGVLVLILISSGLIVLRRKA